MDFVSVLVIGITSGLVSVGSLAVTLKLLKNRLEDEIISSFEQYLTGFLQNFKEKPEVAVAFAKPIVNALIAEYSKGQQEGQGSNADGLMGAGLNFIPRKWRGIAQIAMALMGNGGLNGNGAQNQQQQTGNANKSPFS